MGEGFTIWLHSLVSAKKKKIGSTYDVVESFKNLKLEKVLNQDDLKIVQVGRKPYMVAPPCRVYPTYLPTFWLWTRFNHIESSEEETALPTI